VATSVTLNAVTYQIPAVGESNWGTNVSSYLVALSTGVLQKAGGSFTLTADADFGASYGLKSNYYKSRGTVSTAGILRLANAESVGWRNAANSADKLLKVNSSDILEFEGNPLLTLALGAADTVLRMNSGGTAYEFAKITNSNIDSSAAIAYSKLNLATSIVNADVSASAAIAYSKLNLASSIVDSDVNTSAAIAYSKLAALTVSRLLVSDGSGVVSASSVTSTEAGYLSGVTSAIQTQIDAKQSRSTLTAKGDIYAATASATVDRLPVGTNGQVLSADSGETTGLKWTSVASSSLSQYNTDIGSSSNARTAVNTNLLGEVKGTAGSATVTMTIASPCVVTDTGHGLVTGDKVYLTTTGALPTGLAVDTTYYVVKVDNDSYNLASSLSNAVAGTKINTSGSQSGTHTRNSGGLTYLERVITVSSANATIPDTSTIGSVLVTTGNSDRTITLPTVSTSAGRRILIKKVDSGTGKVIVDTPSSETIDGDAQYNIYTQYGTVTLVCDGSNWYVLESLESGSYTPTFTTNNAGIVTSVNITLLSNSLFQFKRIGKVVTVSGAVNLNAASAGISDFRFTLPIASDFNGTGDLVGTCVRGSNDAVSSAAAGLMLADTTNDAARATVNIANTGNEVVRMIFQYLIA